MNCMAITQMNSKKFIDSVERGVTSQRQRPISVGQTMPIFIPKLMPYMTKGSPVTQSVVTNGNMIFINDSTCKPNAPMIVRTQNYVSPKFESGASWSGIINDYDEDYVPAGTNVSITFPSGNILNPTFRPN